MSSYSFTDPKTGREFSVQVPNGVSFDQAKAIFDQQLNTGSLAGFDVGKSLSAATQAAGGLAGAQAMLSQAAGSLSGLLPSGANLGTITSALGPAAAAAGGQVTAALKGVTPALATNVQIPGLNGQPLTAAEQQLRADRLAFESSGPRSREEYLAAAARGEFSSLGQSSATDGNNAIGSAITAAGSAVTGAVAAVGSLASKAVGALTSAFAGPVTDGINTADLVKQGTTTGLPGLNGAEVQAAMSQAAKLVGQPANVVSDSAGVGKFGFDLSQLELSGIVKKGLSAAVGIGTSILSVLKSPLAFTGKDGIKGLGDLLGNQTAQNNIQKGLMETGLGSLKSAGVPVSDFNPAAIAGLANNAAKSVSGTLQNLSGVASAASKASFESVTRNTAFAVNLADTKVDKTVLGEVTAEPASDTVNTETVNAASRRVIGNDRVPDVADTQPNRVYTEKELKDQLEELKARKFALVRAYTSVAVNIQRDTTIRSSGPQYVQQLEAIVDNFEKIIAELQALQNNANFSQRNQRGLFSLGTGFRITAQLAQQQIGFILETDIPFVIRLIAIINRAIQPLTAAEQQLRADRLAFESSGPRSREEYLARAARGEFSPLGQT